MIKRLIGTLGLFAITIWVGVCGAGYTLSFFGALDADWFSEEWLIQHPIFDSTLLALVIFGTIFTMTRLVERIASVDAGDTKKARAKSFANFADHFRLNKREKNDLIALFNAIEESENLDELAERLEAMGLDEEVIEDIVSDLRCSGCEDYVDGACTILKSKGEPEVEDE